MMSCPSAYASRPRHACRNTQPPIDQALLSRYATSTPSAQAPFWQFTSHVRVMKLRAQLPLTRTLQRSVTSHGETFGKTHTTRVQQFPCNPRQGKLETGASSFMFAPTPSGNERGMPHQNPQICMPLLLAEDSVSLFLSFCLIQAHWERRILRMMFAGPDGQGPFCRTGQCLIREWVKSRNISGPIVLVLCVVIWESEPKRGHEGLSLSFSLSFSAS
jgi:hypothetical protein